jgi:hypothetical protein
VDVPLLQYLDATGTAPAVPSYRQRVGWLDDFRDPRSARAHVRAGTLIVAQWARSLTRVRVCALWAADDPAPFLASARHHLARASQRLHQPFGQSRQPASRARELSSPIGPLL